MIEERKKAAVEGQRRDEEMRKLRDELNGEINRLRTSYDEKIEDLERRLEVALGRSLACHVLRYWS